MIEKWSNAFPSITFDSKGEINVEREGLTIRQYYAGLFMAAILANPNMLDGKDENNINWAKEATIKYTDALIEELNKEKP
jgi:hypothetical protein